MPHVLVFGASKGIGLQTVMQALRRGHTVRAFARSAAGMTISDPKLEKVSGDALEGRDVDAALDGVDVVVQALGVPMRDLFGPVELFSRSTAILVPAMEARGVKRLISVTGFGAGDSRASISCLQRLPFQIVFGRAYDDKSRQERLIKESTLDWTIARPGVLTNGPKTGRYRVLTDPAQWRNGIISRANVADFLVRQVEARDHVRDAPVIVH